MRVSYYQYDWNAGAQVQDRHFEIVMGASEEATKAAWAEDFYSMAGSFDHGGTDHDAACAAAFEKFQDVPKTRSMSVGDIVRVDNKFYLVKPMGFKKIDLVV